ncbi:GtrA family protein [Kitasatospora sp. CM 4170]|uniref:GtrA family protein n=1 Tax=Kitasatospora aburaviensis TaxID=67265 RepID=A0ABW1EXG1_9ACTN|nr:GtrA family protein [Kitasatospora sp. CM 4170]WNM46260.1 GtrA family protein [Kitasatospora sp. CM 4170]
MASAGGPTPPPSPTASAPAASPASGSTRRQLPSFLVIGVLSTLFYLLLFVVARWFTGPQAANLIALAVSAVANTAANRRFTFGVTGSEGMIRHQLQGAVAFVIGLGLSAGALALLDLAVPDASRVVEVVGLVAANGLATVARFLLLKVWVFRSKPSGLSDS